MDLRPSTLRALFLEGMRRANEGDQDDDDAPDDVPAAPAVPSPPAEPPTVQQRPARFGRGQAPGYASWRDGTPFDITAPDEPTCRHPNAHTARVGTSDTLVPYWCPDCKTELYPDISDIPDDQPKTNQPVPEKTNDDQDDNDQDDGEEAAPGRRWTVRGLGASWSMRGSGKKTYSRPVYGDNTSSKQSLIEALGRMRPTTRHGLYNGVAFAIGWKVGVPQFFTAETAHLVHTYHSWTNSIVCLWYFAALTIWAFDYRTRNWLPPFALLARIPLVSLVVGVLLYGNPV